MRQLTPTLLELQGCSTLCAAKIFAESADIRRFETRAAFALNNGTRTDTSLVGQQRAT
jgi:hypothetical protein